MKEIYLSGFLWYTKEKWALTNQSINIKMFIKIIIKNNC